MSIQDFFCWLAQIFCYGNKVLQLYCNFDNDPLNMIIISVVMHIQYTNVTRCKKVQIYEFGHDKIASNAIPFQYEENSVQTESILPHLPTKPHNNKMLHNKMTLPSLKQSVLALPFLWLENAKLLNYKKLIQSNQFQIKHTKAFFRLSNGIFCSVGFCLFGF